MKTTRFFSLAVVTVLCAGFTSCSDDDNPETIQPDVVTTENIKQNLSTVFPKGVPSQVGNDEIQLGSNGLVTRISSDDGDYITFDYTNLGSNNDYDIVMEISDDCTCYLRLNNAGFIEYCMEQEEEKGEIETQEWWFEYNTSGQMTKMKRTEGGNEIFTMTYTAGDITSVNYTDDEGEYNTSSIIYGDSPIENKCGIMLFDYCFNVDLDEMIYAYYAGLLGTATKHLPVAISETYHTTHFEWTFDAAGRPTSLSINGYTEHTFSW